ncbi:MAG: DUF1801 domain-containing protein [Chitinophagales bacterium]|nr:DUF1801 domain-containing protein [Chitinophagales bacterium]
MNEAIQKYNQTVAEVDICNNLANLIDEQLMDAESKIWHSHPVWFIAENPIVGYSKQKRGIRLMFWSGTDFEEESLIPGTGKFKDASIYYNDVSEIVDKDLKRWLKKSIDIQWDYKNLVKRKGKLERLK